MSESLRVVVPSQRRVKNMPTILSLLPDALICVAESERSEYATVVPPEQVLCHKDLPDLPHVRNWLSDTIQEDCLVQIDDDFRGIRPVIGKKYLKTDPELIALAIDNQHRLAQDLDIKVFCWARTSDTTLTHPEFAPLRFVGPLGSSFGLRGAARERRFDPLMHNQADADFTMRTLLHDRIILTGPRWHFDHGRVFASLVENKVGLPAGEDFEWARRELHSRRGRGSG